MNTETIGTTNIENTAHNLGVSVGDLETFRPYDSALPVPALKGYRTVKCLYKVNPRTKVAMAENSYIRVADYITEDLVIGKMNELASIVVDYLQAEEDKLIKSYHVAGALTVKESDLTIESIVEAIEASGVSQRLNKEKIEAWFSAEIEDSLVSLFATKLDIDLSEDAITEEVTEKLLIAVTAYKTKFCSLASGKTHYRDSDVDSLVQVLEATGADDTFIGGRFKVRLLKMKEVTTDSLLLSLG